MMNLNTETEGKNRLRPTTAFPLSSVNYDDHIGTMGTVVGQ